MKCQTNLFYFDGEASVRRAARSAVVVQLWGGVSLVMSSTPYICSGRVGCMSGNLYRKVGSSNVRKYKACNSSTHQGCKSMIPPTRRYMSGGTFSSVAKSPNVSTTSLSSWFMASASCCREGENNRGRNVALLTVQGISLVWSTIRHVSSSYSSVHSIISLPHRSAILRHVHGVSEYFR